VDVDVWALWVPSRTAHFDGPDETNHVGNLQRDTTTLVMQTSPTSDFRYDPRVVRTSIAVIKRFSNDETVTAAEVEEPESGTPPGLAAWVLVEAGLAVTCAFTFLHRGDVGIYAVGTMQGWRRRGFARALMAHVLADAWHRGARTASLQSTRMGQPMYESLGFAAVGRYEEWISQ
jgi:GNAT superfamily N-acetyltransferase